MRQVTCYAWGVPGDWEGICVDYDLAAQGASLEEVRSELSDAIESYLECVMESPDAAERRRFLNRKAPLTLRLRLAFQHRVFAVRDALRLRPNGGTIRAGFVLQAP